LALARSLVSIGGANGVRTEAFISAMDAPLGRAVGNALEIAECIATLQGKGPIDLETLIVTLATRIVVLAGRAGDEKEAEHRVREALESGAALAKFEAVIARQGGDAGVVADPARLPQAAHAKTIDAEDDGFVVGIDAELVGRASMRLGAGRDHVDAVIDPATGIVVEKKPGERIVKGDAILTLHYNDAGRLPQAVRLAASAVQIGRHAPAASPLVRAWVHAAGETSYV
jgi:thymidine phosphorylase